MLIELKQVEKSFIVKRGQTLFGAQKGKIKAVDRVDLSIEKGISLGLVGESGSGKSTLAKIILQLVRADSGSVAVNGQMWTGISSAALRKLRQDVQMVFQDPYESLDPRFTVEKILNEALTLDPERYKTKSQQKERFVEVLDSVGLSPSVLNRYPYEFSGGERQRIAIARSLVICPKLLILDEAVSSLDVLIQGQLLELFNDLRIKFGLTYLFISHNLKFVRKVCPRTAVMYKGRIVEIGSSDDIFSQPLHPYTKELLMAATEYRVPPNAGAVELNPSSRLIEVHPGRFVLEGERLSS